MQHSSWLAGCVVLAVGCAGATTGAPTMISESPPAPSASVAAQGGSPSRSGGAAGHGQAPPLTPAPSSVPIASAPIANSAAAPPAAAAACPPDMKLVEGDYCTKVEQKCKKSWYDKSNRKLVCERFESASVCVGERVKRRFCIDTYEWPNRAGERPEVMNIFYQAELKCAAVSKRLCTESEWTMACEGPKLKPFPYGYERDANKCNGDKTWDGPDMTLVARRDARELARLWQGVRSGSQPHCISDYGVADMPANTDEVVSSETFTSDFRGKYDSVHTGGPWYKGVRNQCRPKIYTHDEGFYYYFLSFRCCAEADHEPTDFRTPRQRKENWKLDRVERLAGWTLAEVKQKLGIKAARGRCGCDDLKGEHQRIKCKTLCGELLGPDAKDAVNQVAQ